MTADQIENTLAGITKRLSGELTHAELQALVRELNPTLQHLETEARRLREGSPERLRVLATGTREDIAGLDALARDARLQRERARALLETLGQRRQQARKAEALAALPALHVALDRQIEAAQQAARKLWEQVARIEGLQSEIAGARAAAGTACPPPPDSAGGLPGRVAALIDAMAPAGRMRGIARWPEAVADALGIERQQQPRADFLANVS